MKRQYSIFLLCLMIGAPMSSGRVGDFSRYKVILERRPFGEPPAEVETPAPSASIPSGPSFADSLRVVAFTYSQGDVRVGFVDTAERPPKTYFLYTGETQDGIEVVYADYESETVVLRKGGEERTLRMAQGGNVVESVRQATAAEAAAAARPRLTHEGERRPAPRPRVMSEARRLRIEEERRRQETVPELHGQVLEKHLQEFNMQAIRTGAPPLPIPLTEEQDAQLVREGILPPAD